MKITFAILSNGNLGVERENAELLMKKEISEDLLSQILKDDKDPFECLPNNILYIAMPMSNGEFKAIKVFFVRCENCFIVWSNQPIYIEDGDIAFTTADEAKAYANVLNKALIDSLVADFKEHIKKHQLMMNFPLRSLVETNILMNLLEASSIAQQLHVFGVDVSEIE